MLNHSAQWRPGSFTKNFSWGARAKGLSELYESIAVGFDGLLEAVPRSKFRERIRALKRPDFIPLNFFLLNAVVAGESFVLVDELVYHSLTQPYGKSFDALALVAFNNSYVGSWVGAAPWQQYPAAWAFFYVTERLAKQLSWDIDSVNADDIQKFVVSSGKYTGETSRKLATNLSYMYKIGGLDLLSSGEVSRLWADAAFLCLDRVVAESAQTYSDITADELLSLLDQTKFDSLSGLSSFNRKLAIEPLCKLYAACGGMKRWSVESVHERQKILIPHINEYLGSNEPWLVVDPLDATLTKAIPQACAMLARYLAGFEEIGDVGAFDVEGYVKARTQDALAHLKAINVSPRLSAEDLLRLTRG